MTTATDYEGVPANDLVPAVGMPATYEIGSDSYAGTIVEIHRGGLTLVWRSTSGRLVKTFTRKADRSYALKGHGYGYLTLGDTSPTNLDPGF